MIVAGNYYLLRSDLNTCSFTFCCERIVVCPLFHVLSSYLLGTHLFYDNYFLAIITVPPNVVAFDVRVWVLLANGS